MGDKVINILMEKSIVDGGNDEKKPLSLERRELSLKGRKKKNITNSKFSKRRILHV